jgi:uncharacterized repeat protein (TIGR01451 family)
VSRPIAQAVLLTVGLGVLITGRVVLAQDKGASPPAPVPIDAMSGLPPLPEPATTPPPPAPMNAPPPAPMKVPSLAPAPSVPASFPAPVKVDSEPVLPGAPPSADPASNFATLPRSSEAPPGRPPAFRLLVRGARAQATSHYATSQPEPRTDIPVVSASPALTLEKKGPESIVLGQPLVYELIVRNVGAVPAQQVRVDDALPPGTRVLAAEPEAPVQGDRLSWVLDNLPPGGERHFKVKVQPAAAGDWRGNACASVVVAASSSLHTRVIGTGGAAPGQPTAPRSSLPERKEDRAAMNLSISLAGPQSVAVGQPAVFQIRITNNGRQTLRGLVLRDHVPPGLQHTAGPELEADLGTLEAGKTRNITLTTNAVQAGRFINEATIASSDGQQAEARAAIQIVATTQAH